MWASCDHSFQMDTHIWVIYGQVMKLGVNANKCWDKETCLSYKFMWGWIQCPSILQVPKLYTQHSVRGDFWASSDIKVHVFPSPTGNMLWSFSFLFWFGIYSLDSSKMMGNFHEVLKFNCLFLKLNQFIWN